MRLSQYTIHLWWLIPLLILDAFLFSYWWRHYYRPAPPEAEIQPEIPAESREIEFGYPTDRELGRFNPDNFQPTASGRPESAYYGSVRSGWHGKRLLPSFHEGIDIAPLERDKTGRAVDKVYAAAGGEVAYVNRVAGNSNYGKYVVLVHGPRLEKVYSLYAHLDKIAPDIRTGRRIGEGQTLGIMGATPENIIPAANGHLHFEIGIILNSRFSRWFNARRSSPDHGIYNGWNLFGIDPLAVYEKQEETGGGRDLYDYFRGLPAAFEIVLRRSDPLDFFRRYPGLWEGAVFQGGGLVIKVSENGLPLGGRCASGDDMKELNNGRYALRAVNPGALGRNGCRLVVAGNGRWRLGAEGEKWLSILTY